MHLRLCGRSPVALGALLAGLLIGGACHRQGGGDRLDIVAPGAPGGGWDQTARAMQQALRAADLARMVQVANVGGAGGTIGLAQFVSGYRGDGHALLVGGLVMLAAIRTNRAAVSLEQTTPIARLTGEYEVVAVPAASPIHTLRDLVAALRADPGAVSWAGGSAGGTDHLLVVQLAQAIGVPPARANYVAFSGGGEAVTALLGNQVSAGVSGYGEFAPYIETGRLRALALSAPTRIPGVNLPTFTELGIPLELTNWRGVVAPPGIGADARRRLIALMEAMVKSQPWHAVMAQYGWHDLYLAGDAFGEFLKREDARVNRLLREAGLAQ